MSKPNIHKENYTKTDRKINNKVVCMKSYQSTAYNTRKAIMTDVMTPAPNEDALQNGSQIKYNLTQNSVRHIKTITLRFQIRMDNRRCSSEEDEGQEA